MDSEHLYKKLPHGYFMDMLILVYMIKNQGYREEIKSGKGRKVISWTTFLFYLLLYPSF